jgi:integrase
VARIKDRWYRKDKTPTARCGQGRRWQVIYQLDGKERPGGTYDTKAAADAQLTKIKSDLQRGEWVDPSDTTTVAEWMRIWADQQDVCKRTADRYDRDIRNHIEGTAFGARPLNKLRVSDARDWQKRRAALLAVSSLTVVVRMVSSAFRAARADHLMGPSPFAKVQLPEWTMKRFVPLRTEQVEAVVNKVGRRYRCILIVQAGLGLRCGEALGLRLKDVDFLQHEVHIRKQADPDDTGELIDLKTPSSERTLPLPDGVARELSAHIKAFPVGTGKGEAEGLLFHTSSGRPLSRSAYHTRIFKGAVRALHKADPTYPLETSSHDLRHYYATTLLDAGESMVAVAELLGHQDATMVMKVYGHRKPGTGERVRKAIDAAFQSTPAVQDESQAVQRRSSESDQAS